MTDPLMRTEIFAPHCGPHERIMFCGKVAGTDEAVCVCLQPGLHYGFHFGTAGQPLQVSFSVEDLRVHGDFDWELIDGVEWASLSTTHDGVKYTCWVSRPETDGELPRGRFEVAGDDIKVFELEPASIVHDLPFD